MNKNTKEDTRIDLREFGQSPFSLRLWHGMAFDAWMRAMRGKWHLVSPRRYPLVLTITVASVGNQFLKWASQLVYGARLAKVEIEPDPVFVIGHWRSGTTWLHQIMMTDPRHAAPSVQACFMPETFLIARGAFEYFLRWVLPEKRPMDNVALTPESAEEDEHGISLSGGLSPYREPMFPNNASGIPFGPDDMSEADAAFWRKTWLAFLRRVQFINPGKRLILKSPTHTLRTKEILRLFPEARFVHIVRDPYKIFLSSRKSRKAMHSVCALQDHLPSQDVRDARMIERFVEFHDRFDADRPGIPDDRIITIRYEDLRSDTLGVIEKVYDHLDLGSFDAVAPAIKELVGTPKPYQNNKYDLDAATQAKVDAAYAPYFKRYGYLTMSERPAP